MFRKRTLELAGLSEVELRVIPSKSRRLPLMSLIFPPFGKDSVIYSFRKFMCLKLKRSRRNV